MPTTTATPRPSATATATPTGTATATLHPSWTATPTSTPTPIVISQGTAAGRLIALTFDCGADRGTAPEILAYLRQQGIVASFGVTGYWAEQNPDLVRRMAAQGDQIIDHTYDHQSFTGVSTHTRPLSAEQIATELNHADAVLRHLTGSSTRPYLRTPYGDESPAALAAARAAGFSIDVRWSADSLDWEGLSAAQIEMRVLNLATPGGIVMMHVGAASQDALALPHVVAALRAQGYHFVTVAQLLSADHRRGAPRSAMPTSYRAVDPDAVYYPSDVLGPLSRYIVVLDPGHGGDDPGTCYPFGFGCFPSSDPSAAPVLDEKTVTLDLALYRLLPRLHLLGADVYLTRTTQEQNTPLEERLQLANYVARMPGTRGRALFISVHLNGSGDPTVDYSQALYAARRPSLLAATLAAAFGAAIEPAPSGGDHGIETFPGHVLRRNRLPATIVEPTFLTNVYPVVMPISVTTIVTSTSGSALRQGLRLHDPTVYVRALRRQGRHHAVVALRETFLGRVRLGTAISVARTAAIAALLAIHLTRWMPLTTSRLISLTAPATPTLPAGSVGVAIPPSVTYAISVSGAVSSTTQTTTYQGEGPWLMRAHLATLHANLDYDTPAPARLPLRYAWTDREETIADGLLSGIAAFFHVALPRWTARPWTAPVALDPVAPPG